MIDSAVGLIRSQAKTAGPDHVELDRLLRFTELKGHNIPFSRPHIDRLERDGRFPRRVRLGPATVGWWRSEIWQWLADKTAERGGA